MQGFVQGVGEPCMGYPSHLRCIAAVMLHIAVRKFSWPGSQVTVTDDVMSQYVEDLQVGQPLTR